MRIKDLPKDIKERALANQVAQGYQQSDDLHIHSFNWFLSAEGFMYWIETSIGQFDKARKLLEKETNGKNFKVEGTTIQTEEYLTTRLDNNANLSAGGINTRSYNVGNSDYSKYKIQPWDIWEEYNLNPWDADIVKRILRKKEGEDRVMDYEKIIHVCKERIRQLKNK